MLFLENAIFIFDYYDVYFVAPPILWNCALNFDDCHESRVIDFKFYA